MPRLNGLLSTSRSLPTRSAIATLALLLSNFVAFGPLAAGQFDYLDRPCDPYYVSRNFPKLTTPQWFGEPGVDCVVVLAIDDMRDSARYEAYLRPILDRLKQIDGRAAVSIMSCQVDPADQQLQSWLKEGVSLEVHTFDHPCPLLQGGDFAKAKNTVDRCVDLLAQVPGNQPVAYRMPCCDSLNTPSPRFWTEIFDKTTGSGNFLSIDSSVFQIHTAKDTQLPANVTTDEDGRPKFRKYLPFPSFVNTIEDYPYPYVIGRTCWEFPCAVPSDWEAQNLHQPMNPRTVEDWKSMLDAAVIKQGTVSMVFHPHGWIRSEQVVEWIDYAQRRYGPRVKFITFQEAITTLNSHLLDGMPLRAPDGTRQEVAMLDLNADGFLDVVLSDRKEAITTKIWDATTQQWNRVVSHIEVGRPRFGWLGKSVGPVMLESTADSQPWQAWRWHRSQWESMPWSLDATMLDADLHDRLGHREQLWGTRLVDIDGDGTDEWYVCHGGEQRLFSWHDPTHTWRSTTFQPPHDVPWLTQQDGDAGLRLVDLNGDNRLDLLFSDGLRYSVDLFDSAQNGWSRRTREGKHAVVQDGLQPIPSIVRADGSNNGAWFHSGSMWVQNEDTHRMPDLVDRRSYRELVKSDTTTATTTEFPPPLDPQAALARFHVAAGMRIELVVAEPLVEDPVAFDWGPDGTLWVVEMRDYPSGIDGNGKPGGRVKRIRDTDGDGRYDHATTFLDDIPYPNGIKSWRNGVLVTAAPEIFYAEDTDADGIADLRKSLYVGFGEGNQQHRANGLRWGVDQWLYVANGDSGGTIESASSGQTATLRGRDLRIRPDDGSLETIEGQTQFGRDTDDEGNWFGGNNSQPMWHYLLESRYLKRNPYFSAPYVYTEVFEQRGAAPVFPESPLLPRFNDFDRANRFTSACTPIVYRDNKIGDGLQRLAFVCEPVHNLVHREVMERNGTSFISRRANTEQASEFLAAEDNWFRPVMVRTGPDGAVWVADMYRLVIEHPEWIPASWQAKVDVRSGDDRGRIYRILPVDDMTPTVPRQFDHLPTEQLVAHLDSPNGWQRDTVQQLLLWRHDPEAIPHVKALVRKSNTAWTPIPALYLLDTWNALTTDELLTAIESPVSAVSRHAMRLAESRREDAAELAKAICRRADRGSSDLPLLQQVAYSLGEFHDASSHRLLGTLLARHGGDYGVRMAVISSLGAANIEIVMESARTVHLQSRDSGSYMAPLFAMMMSLGSDDAIRAVGERLFDDWRTYPDEVAAAVLAEATRTLARRDKLPLWNSGTVRNRLDAVASQGLELALDDSTDFAQRVRAIESLTLPLLRSSDRVNQLAAILNAQQPPEVQRAAVEALAAAGGDEGIRVILQNWNGFAPRLRETVLEAMLGDSSKALRFLEAVKDDTISPTTVGASGRQRLLSYRDQSIRDLAKEVLGAGQSTDRQAVVEQYVNRKELAQPGNVERGRVVFQQRCATCHAFDGMGQAIGPDLAALTDKTVPSLLTAILDPNRAVEDRYHTYQIELADGQILDGMLATENATGIVMFAADGKQRSVLRREIVDLVSSGKSLMPEGFERDLSPQDLADVVTLLRTKKAKRKVFPGNDPQVAPVRDDGSIRLFAIYSQIFGPSLVLEETHRNLGYWGSTEDYALWDVDVPRAGKYEVVLVYACNDSTAGNRFELTIAGKQLTGRVQGTGTWDDYTYRSVGTIELPAGPCEAVFRAHGALEGHLLDLNTIILEPQ